jgi:hypothetical protein
VPTIPQRRFLKGLVASAASLVQPPNTVQRVSNLLYNKRGGLIDNPGSNTLASRPVITGGQQITTEFFLFQPTGMPALWLLLVADANTQLATPTGLAVTTSTSTVNTFAAGSYSIAITAIDNIGGTTLMSAPVAFTGDGSHYPVLSWNVVEGAAGYIVWLKLGSGAWAVALVVGPQGNLGSWDNSTPPVFTAESGTISLNLPSSATTAATIPTVNNSQVSQLVMFQMGNNSYGLTGNKLLPASISGP